MANILERFNSFPQETGKGLQEPFQFIHSVLYASVQHRMYELNFLALTQGFVKICDVLANLRKLSRVGPG